jgi:hypothetical protein
MLCLFNEDAWGWWGKTMKQVLLAGASRLSLFAGSPADATTMTVGYLRRGRIG